MAEKKISGLTLIDAVSDGDLFEVTDDPSGTPVSKKATRSQILATCEKTANRGVANGYATLDSGILVPLTQIPTLPLSKIIDASAASRLLGRGSAGGAGDFEEISLGTGLTMTGQVLSAGAAVAYGWDTLYPLTAPVDANYSWTNQGGASIANSLGSLLLSGPATAGDSLRIRRKAAPGTPYTVTACMQPLTGSQASNGATYGIGFRQSSDGKLHLLMVNQAAGSIYSIKFTNETTFSATYTSATLASLNLSSRQLPINYLRIKDDGASRIVYWSTDGVEWTQFHTIGRTDFLTADQVLFFVNAADASIATSVRLLSWLEA